MFLFAEKHHSGEEEFSIEIPDEDAERMGKISDLIEYVKNKISIILNNSGGAVRRK